MANNRALARLIEKVLDERAEFEPWMLRGACRDWLPQPSDQPNADPLRDPWFPSTTNVEEAQDVCSTCPVREQCDAYAERIRATVGIWAGKSQRGRMREMREARNS